MQLVQPIGLTMSAKDDVTARLPSDRKYAGTPFEGVFFSETRNVAEQAYPEAPNAEDETDPAGKTVDADADRTDITEELEALAGNVPKDPDGAAEQAKQDIADTPALEQSKVHRTDRHAGSEPDAAGTNGERGAASSAKHGNPDERHHRASPISAMVEGLSFKTTPHSGAQSVPFVDDSSGPQNTRSNHLESDARLTSLPKAGGGQGHTSAPTEKHITTLAVLQSNPLGRTDGFVSKTKATMAGQDQPIQTSLSPSRHVAIGTINPSGGLMPTEDGPPLPSAFRNTAGDENLLAKQAKERTGPPDLPLPSTRRGIPASPLVAATLPPNQGPLASRTSHSFLPPQNREPFAFGDQTAVHSGAATQRDMAYAPIQSRPTGIAHSPSLTTEAAQDPLAKGISTFAELDLPPDTDVPIWDVRPAATSSHGALTLSHLQRAEMPPHIGNAIAEAFRKSPDKPIELALNPAELGRVRIVMTHQDTGIVVTITAERGDTLDLMRRNIDDLGRSLNDLGFADVSFEFSQDQDASANRDDNMPDERSPDPGNPHKQQVGTPEPSSHAITQATATTGIDMRL